MAHHIDSTAEYTLLINEAAKLMGVSRRTVYYRISDGTLTKIKTIGGSTRVLVPSVALLIQLGQRKNGRRRRGEAVRSQTEAQAFEVEPLA